MRGKLIITILCFITFSCHSRRCLDPKSFPVSYKVKTIRGTYCVKPIKSDYNYISGTIRSRRTGEILRGVIVSVEDTKLGTLTDEQGRFKLELQPGKSRLIVSSVGYLDMKIKDVRLKDYESLEFIIYLGDASTH